MNQIRELAKDALLQRQAAIFRVFQGNQKTLDGLMGEPESDVLDQAQIFETSRVLEKLSDEERGEISEINKALARISAGTYGKCENCNQAIGRQRLRALPEARFCIVCSEIAEKTKHASD